MPEIPAHSIITVDETLRKNYSLIAYLYFYKYISLDTENEHEYFLCTKGFEQYDSAVYFIYKQTNENLLLLKRK